MSALVEGVDDLAQMDVVVNEVAASEFGGRNQIPFAGALEHVVS